MQTKLCKFSLQPKFRRVPGSCSLTAETRSVSLPPLWGSANIGGFWINGRVRRLGGRFEWVPSHLRLQALSWRGCRPNLRAVLATLDFENMGGGSPSWGFGAERGTNPRATALIFLGNVTYTDSVYVSHSSTTERNFPPSILRKLRTLPSFPKEQLANTHTLSLRVWRRTRD